VLEEDKLATRFQDSSNTPNSFGNAGNRTQRKRANRRIDCAVGQRNAKSETDDAFSNARIYKGPLPSLAIGAIVEEETTVADKLPFFSGGSVYRAYLSRDVPDTHVAMLISGTQLTAPTDPTWVPTTQLGPLLLCVLGMEKFDLDALHHEHTPALPGIF
jgi:hypothetical protein